MKTPNEEYLEKNANWKSELGILWGQAYAIAKAEMPNDWPDDIMDGWCVAFQIVAQCFYVEDKFKTPRKWVLHG